VVLIICGFFHTATGFIIYFGTALLTMRCALP
jgi:hypothetical protein